MWSFVSVFIKVLPLYLHLERLEGGRERENQCKFCCCEINFNWADFHLTEISLTRLLDIQSLSPGLFQPVICTDMHDIIHLNNQKNLHCQNQPKCLLYVILITYVMLTIYYMCISVYTWNWREPWTTIKGQESIASQEHAIYVYIPFLAKCMWANM